MGISGHPWVVTALCMVASYFICGIPFGLIMGKLVDHVDIRRSGSGNIGATNAARVGGPLVGGLTLVCDVSKGFICVTASKYIISWVGFGTGIAAVAPGTSADVMVALIALCSIGGHVFSPYLKFHGGKGIAAGLGVLLALDLRIGLTSLVGFTIVLLITKYVSAGSITGGVLAPISVQLYIPEATLAYKIIILICAIIVIVAHHENIKRIINGTESQASIFSKGRKKDAEGDAGKDGSGDGE